MDSLIRKESPGTYSILHNFDDSGTSARDYVLETYSSTNLMAPETPLLNVTV